MTDLNCDELVELVTDSLDGALDDETERRVIGSPTTSPVVTAAPATSIR